MKNKPCIFYGEGENGKYGHMKPAVNCTKNCVTCGWNPLEQERRLKEGHFVKDATVIIRHFSSEQDNRGTPVPHTGLRQLRFRSFYNRTTKSSA